MNKFMYDDSNDDAFITNLENMFINHYMIKARGDYVKVYIYGLKCCQRQSPKAPTFEGISKVLSLTEGDVSKAFKYWQQEGIVDIINKNGHKTVVYKNIINMFLNPKVEKDVHSQRGDNKDIKISNMFESLEKDIIGRPLTKNELEMFLIWLEDYEFSTGTIKLLVSSCVKKDKKSKNYWNAIAMDWYDRGIKTYDEAAGEIKSSENKYKRYKEIFKYLALNTRGSGITKPEMDIIDKWFDEYALSMKQVKEACDETLGINKPNLKYVDTVIRNWYFDEEGNRRKKASKVKKSQSQRVNKDKNNKMTINSDSEYNPIDLEKSFFGD